MHPEATLVLRLSEPGLAGFASFFSTGVGIETVTGTGLVEFLCDQLGIARAYLDRHVQTIFVNSLAVDRTDNIIIDDGDVIALSAAMPGLAGATLRKGGILASFRKEISYTNSAVGSGKSKKALVILKLFNLVALELAPHLFQRGVWVRGKQIAGHFQQLAPSRVSGIRSLVYNGTPVTVEELPQLCQPEAWIFFSITNAQVP